MLYLTQCVDYTTHIIPSSIYAVLCSNRSNHCGSMESCSIIVHKPESTSKKTTHNSTVGDWLVVTIHSRRCKETNMEVMNKRHFMMKWSTLTWTDWAWWPCEYGWSATEASVDDVRDGWPLYVAWWRPVSGVPCVHAQAPPIISQSADNRVHLRETCDIYGFFLSRSKA